MEKFTGKYFFLQACRAGWFSLCDAQRKKNPLKTSAALLFFQNLQTLLGAVSRRNYIFSTQLHPPQPYYCAEGGVHLAASPGLHF